MTTEWSQGSDLLVPLTNIDFNPPIFEELATQGIEIKRAAPMDSSKILSLVQAEFSQNWCDEVAFALRNRDCWIAEDAGNIVGFIVINAQAPDFTGPVAVVESHRGKGIANALTVRAFEGLYHQGYRYAICGWVTYSTYQYVKKYIAQPIVLTGGAYTSFGNRINGSSEEKPVPLKIDSGRVQGVQHYRQTDPRYADKPVGTLTFEKAGCGPCAIANIVERDPVEILTWLQENGYVSSTQGTFWQGIPAALEHFGGNGQLLCEERLCNEPNHPCFAQLKDHLRAGLPGIILFGPGNWTRSAHFVNAVGYSDEQDAVFLVDPKGEDRDGRYPWSVVVAQAQTCFIAIPPRESKGKTH